MKVYRYLAEKELNSLINGDTSNIGNYYNDSDYSRVNTHKYQNDKKYLHFFLHKKDISYCKGVISHGLEECYYCTFNIPLRILLKYRGKDRYNSKNHPYSCGIYLEITEFAIPVDEILPLYLRKYERDEIRHRIIIENKKERELFNKAFRLNTFNKDMTD